MSTRDGWVVAYARQAAADFSAWEDLRRLPAVAPCIRLMPLQMACEKLCKAHLIKGGTPPETVQGSHAYVANPLPVVLKKHITDTRQRLKGMAWVMEHARHLAREIELLAPAVKRGGQRPDNCEYPWADDAGEVRSPLDWTFAPSTLLLAPAGRTFLKLVHGAIQRLL